MASSLHCCRLRLSSLLAVSLVSWAVSWSCSWVSAFTMAAATGSSSSDLYIVGCGYLGKIVASEWLSSYPGSRVFGETNSEGKHEELRAMGVTPRLRSDRDSSSIKYGNVIFCAPPSGSSNYPGEVAAAAQNLWDGSGSFVFTSSGGVYANAAAGDEPLTEDAPLGDTPRQLKLVESEQACLDANGTVMRLAGLYSAERGAHSFWIAKGEVQGRPESLVNLLSYEDAAGAVLACVRAGSHVAGMALLASDHCPMTRKEICEAGLSHPLYKGMSMPTFKGDGEISKKSYDCSKTIKLLSWKPKYASFREYMGVSSAESE